MPTAVKERSPARGPSKPPQDFRIGFLVHDVSRMRRTLFDQAMKPLGITRSQWWVLSRLPRRTQDGTLRTEEAGGVGAGIRLGHAETCLLLPSGERAHQCLHHPPKGTLMNGIG